MDVERVVEDDVVKLAKEQVQQNQYIDTIPVVRENGNFYCHERPVCSLKPVTSKLSWFHGVNSSSDSEGEVGIEIIGFG